MGDEVSGTGFTREERQRYREKVQLCLDVFERMLSTTHFDAEQPMTGLEVELNLVDADYQPFLGNMAVLEEIADPAYQTELGAYNIELNVPPQPLAGDASLRLEASLRASLNAAEEKANRRGGHIVMVGILPTLMPEHLAGESWMSPSARYQALENSIFAARGEDIHLDITGVERLATYADTLAPESACTSVQLHLQVAPADFARNWNASQVIAGPQLAMGANSPYFFGHELWRETRIELFAQSTDTRPQELRNQGVRPRVWFGERWITSIFDLFEENVRYFPALLPEVTDEDPLRVLESGAAPRLQELRLHNGTIYRWNRPVYDVVDGVPHVRVENRVLPAGPTVVDILANSAFYYGALRVLAEDDRPVWTKLTFPTAEENFHECARRGLDATVYWPGLGDVTVDELVLRRLLPMAYEGLDRWGVDPAVRDRYLGIIEERAKTGRNGAAWQTETVQALEGRGAPRAEALRQMLALYVEGMHSNEPVHTWPVP
ncbi:glutamate--cysteine ligase [Kineosporia sp. R_H_3]|uniref:glutamate--cysteine ligase n=1 Tax=Kineosporia sp. R_H_3 TaxID=1961848 RepID=UPI000B4BF2F6|nr:glutamate--cysteine ligase [Kineosporia sp. R_H_3]